jgi:hypothetical protein
MQLQVAFDLIGCARAMLLHLAPVLGVGLKEDSPSSWIDVAPMGEVASDAIQRSDLHLPWFELLALLRAALVLAPSRPVVPVGSLVDTGHGLSCGPWVHPRGPAIVLSIEDFCGHFRTLPDTHLRDVSAVHERFY